MASSRFVLSFTILLFLIRLDLSRSLIQRKFGRELLLSEQCITLQNTCSKSVINVAIAFRTKTHSWRIRGWINVGQKSTREICWKGLDRGKIWLLTNNPLDDVNCEFGLTTPARSRTANSGSSEFRVFCVNAISIFDVHQEGRSRTDFRFRSNLTNSKTLTSNCSVLGRCYKLSAFERFEFGSALGSRVKKLALCT